MLHPVFTPLCENFKIRNKMKKFFVIIVTFVSLVSCTKQVASLPGADNQNTFFKNANIAVENMTAKATATSTVTISFSTLFENNISRIELMSGTNTNNFCAIKSVDITGASSAQRNYSFTDANAKGSTMYYLLRFEDSYGNWTYSSYVTVQVN